MKILGILLCCLFTSNLCSQSQNLTIENPEGVGKLLKEREDCQIKPEPIDPEILSIPTKVVSYNIQLEYTKSRKAIEIARKNFNKKYHLEAEIQYKAPNFVLIVGEYSTRESAKKDLHKFRKEYPTALITPEVKFTL